MSGWPKHFAGLQRENLLPPTTRCANCGDTVRAKAEDGQWVFPVDERGWCGDCTYMEGVEQNDTLSLDEISESIDRRLGS